MKLRSTMTDAEFAASLEQMRRVTPITSGRRHTEKPVAPPPKVSGCVHRMRLEEPKGATVHGICQFCGWERDYVTAPEELNKSMTIGNSGRW